MEVTQSRFLYTVATGVDLWTVGTTVSFSTNIIPFSSGITTDPLEADLSDDGSKLAWSNWYGDYPNIIKYFVINLDVNGNYIPASLKTIIGNSGVHCIKSQEFSADHSKLYFIDQQNTGQGYYLIEWVDLTNPSSLPQTITNWTPISSATKLERAYDGRIYAATLTNIQGINTTTNLIDNYITCSPVFHHGFGMDFYNLPDQLDGYNYDDQFLNNSPYCCSEETAFDAVSYQIQNSGTWTTANNPIHLGNSKLYINGILKIPSGINLTIQGMTIEFGLSGKIELDGTAHLILDNSTVKGLTTCNTMWLGIDILNNGYVNTINNSKIEEAINGINNETNGEILCSAGTTFLNNLLSIYSKSSVRTRCYSTSFYANSNYNNLNHPLKIGNTINQFVNLTTSWMSINLNYFGNCTFAKDPLVIVTDGILSSGSNYQVYANTFTSIPYGINSYDDNVNINSCNFSGNTYGIYYLAEANPSINLIANASTFQDDWCGIYLSGSDYDYIYLNSFNPAGNSIMTNFYGIYNNGATYFGIYDNTFNYIKYGIFSYKGQNGKIKNYSASLGNNFTNCWRGIHTSDDNSGTPIKCNTFSNSTSNLSVHWYIGGPLSTQGSSIFDPPNYTNPAGNEFNQLSTKNSIISGYNFIYNSHNSPPSCIPNIPSGYTRVVTSMPKTSGSCPSESGNYSQMNIGGIISQLSSNSISTISKESLIDNAIEHFIINQTTDSISQFLENYSSFEHAKWLLIPAYIQSKKFIMASALLNNISVKTNNKIDTDKVYKKELYNILLNWRMNNITAFDMSANDQVSLRQMAQIKTQAGINAQNILHLVFGDEFPYTWVRDSLNTNARLSVTNPAINDTTSEYLSAPFPNPTNSESNFKYFVPDYVNNAEFNIYDVTGRNIKTIKLVKGEGNINIHTSELNTGIYFCELIFNKGIIDKRKIVIYK